MSRHGYSDEFDGNELAMWRGVIASASRGKRGQAFFRALVAALDAMPVKELAYGALETVEGSVCALGALGKARGVDLADVETADWGQLGELFDIAPQLAQETMYVNDEAWVRDGMTTGARWQQVRRWAARQIRLLPDEIQE